MEIIFNSENFQDEVLNYEDGPVLVDFFASWCSSCMVQGPIIEQLGKELDGAKIKVGILDVDQNADLVEKYSVMSLPTLVIFKNGEVKETLHGLHNADVLKEKLESYK